MQFQVKPDLCLFDTLLLTFAKCWSYFSNFGFGPELILFKFNSRWSHICLMSTLRFSFSQKMLIIFIKFRPRTGTEFISNSVPADARFRYGCRTAIRFAIILQHCVGSCVELRSKRNWFELNKIPAGIWSACLRQSARSILFDAATIYCARLAEDLPRCARRYIRRSNLPRTRAFARLKPADAEFFGLAEAPI